MPFCDEHSEVMRCLGALEEGQKNMAGDIREIKEATQSLTRSIANGKTTTAIEKTKTSVLYGAIIIVCAGAVAAALNFLFKHIG